VAGPGPGERPAPTPGASALRRVALNTALGVAGKAVVLVIGVASIVVLTRYLGTDGYGRYGLALSYTQLFAILADVGLFTIVVREVSRRPERASELVGNALALRGLLSLGVVALAAGVSLLLPYTPDVRLAIVIAGIPLGLGLMNASFVALFQARLQMGWAVIGEVLGRAAAFAGAVTVALLDLGFHAAVGAVGVGALVQVLVTGGLARRLAAIRPRFELRVWRELVVAALPLGIALAVNEVYFRADMFIISLSRSFEELGLYAVAYRVLELGATFPGVFLGSVFPVLVGYIAGADPRLRGAMQTAADAFLLAGAGLAVGGAVLAPAVVELIGGAEFSGSAAPLRVLLLAAALSFVNGLFGYALIAKARQLSALWLNVTALALNLVLNIILIPPYGIMAAAWTTAGCEVVVLAGSFLLMRRHFGFFPSFGLLARALPAAAAMGAVLWPVRHQPALLTAPAGAALYGVLLYAAGGLDRELLARLRRP
jgi:O-antigen/teichoic acid export membrane protein